MEGDGEGGGGRGGGRGGGWRGTEGGERGRGGRGGGIRVVSEWMEGWGVGGGREREEGGCTSLDASWNSRRRLRNRWRRMSVSVSSPMSLHHMCFRNCD